MDFFSLIALFGIILVMAAVPSSSVVVVVTRSVAYGFKHGVSASAGIVSGDLVFVVIALGGLSALTEVLGEHFVFAKYMAGAYLIWFGFSLLRSRNGAEITEHQSRSLLASYLAGFLLTLGDIKAVFFYASLLPVFIEVSNVSLAEAAVISLLVIGTVGSVKLAYAYLAHKMGSSVCAAENSRTAASAAGGVSISAGIILLAKA